MKALNEYRIAFRGLSDGGHDFTWEIGKSFFEKDPESGIRDAAIRVDLTLTKSNRLFNLNFIVKGSITLACDRCLGDLVFVVDSEHPLIVRESDRGEEGNDDILFITSGDYELDLLPVIYDFILLSLPMRRVHEEKQCDPEMIKRIEDIRIEEADDEM